LAQRLNAFAAVVGPGTWADLLRKLANAIEQDTDLHLWGGVDLYAMFGDAAALVPPPPQPWWKRALIAAPAVLVFIPLLATWFSLAKATSAYREALAGDPTLVGRSFLEMWQTGMAGRLDAAYVFDRAAFYTLTGLVVLVVSVVVAGILRHQRDAEIDRFDLEMNQGLHTLLAEASLVIAENKLTSPQRFTKELNKAAKEMRELQAKTTELQETAAGSIAGVQSSLDAAVKASADLGTSVIAANQTSALIATQQTQIRDLLLNLDKTLAIAVTGGVGAGLAPITASMSNLEQTQHRLESTVSKAESEFSSSAAHLTAGLQGQLSGMEAAVDLMGQISGRFDELRRSLERLSGELAATRGQGVS